MQCIPPLLPSSACHLPDLYHSLALPRAVKRLRNFHMPHFSNIFCQRLHNQWKRVYVYVYVGVMAPLYKRYIPPKATAIPVSTTLAAEGLHSASPADAGAASNGTDEKKRKRERSEDEVAERKAKKLRKKGFEAPEQAARQKKPAKAVAVPAELSEPTPTGDVGTAATADESKSEFAHITNVKKRHKLEKEARKARKAAEKNVKEAGEPEVSSGEAGYGAVKAVEDAGHEMGAVRDAGVEADETVEVKKSKKRRREKSASAIVEHTNGHDGVTTGEVTANGEKIARKKEKMQRKSEAVVEPPAQVESPAQQSQDDPAAQVDETTVPDPPPSQSKKRRHRLEAVLTQNMTNEQVAEAVAGADADVKDHHLQRHGAVFSKFQIATKHAQSTEETPSTGDVPSEEPVILRDLVPLPQPEKAPTPEFKPDTSALPTWLAKPTVISNDSKASFSALGLESKTVEQLSDLGFTEALPVQQGIIPLLLPPGVPGASFFPGSGPVLPDLAVSAATGSGKTIAYLLPIVEALKCGAHGTGRLQALVVVPTRELVAQVTGVAEGLARGSGVKVGTATGSGKLKEEQEKLVRQSRRHDPEGYAKLMAKAHRRNYPLMEESDDDFADEDGEEFSFEDSREKQRIDDAVSGLIDHVPTYHSAVDILICTPGRLIEHLNTTLGFTLAHLRWLVLDEADKLLGQQYDGFLETLNDSLSRERTAEEQDARETYLRKKDCWDEQREQRVRKVILSATMTRDVSQLTALRLHRPKMVVVRGKDTVVGGETAPNAAANEVEGVKDLGDGFELPSTLVEYCVPVGEGNEKPLFLVNLLQEKILPDVAPSSDVTRNSRPAHGTEDDASDSESDLDSTTSSELSSSSSDPSSDSDDDSASSSDGSSDTEDQPQPETAAVHPDRAALFASQPNRTNIGDIPPTILIFTSSNESAARLSHLIRNLKPEWSSWITTLTKSRPNRTTASNTKSPSITISTDRSSRGLDSLHDKRAITHVIQYDVPRSLTGYVHRVGRTARAGRSGEAWTLYTHTEAHWFLHQVARAKKVRRAGEVEKVKLSVEDEALKTKYEEVLMGMRAEVFGGKVEKKEE